MRSTDTAWMITSMIFVTIVIAAGMAGCPQYNVYRQRLDGQAQLAHAQFSKEIAVAEAKAKMESAELLAKAEVIRANAAGRGKMEAAEMLAKAEVTRAKGVAQANEIIGASLQNNEGYLRYLWIMEVASHDTDKTVVYVPTEASMPLLEAGRLHLPRRPPTEGEKP